MTKVKAVLALSMLASLAGCAYGGVGVSGDKAVVLRNDGFLFGILRQVFVCKVDSSGLSNCNSNVSP
jgi:hypothetical protein